MTSNSSANLRATITSNTTIPMSSTAIPVALSCYPFQDPDAGPAFSGCRCDGLNATFPYLSSSSGQSDYSLCDYTTTPTIASATAAPFTTTESNGDVVACASSAYYNFAVNEIPTCAGASSIVSTVASIASIYSVSTASVASVSAASVSAASASAASASAVQASAAAVPTAGCWILFDDLAGGSSFEIYDINGWAGSKGEKLFKQERGCGILSGKKFYARETLFTRGTNEPEVQMRDTQYAYFGLMFFKAGCVERAVHSAGGPPPGTKPGELACHHKKDLSDHQSNAVSSIRAEQLKVVKSVADGGSANSSLSSSNEEMASVDTSPSSPAAVGGSQPDPNLVASASAAPPHLLVAQSGSPATPTATSG